MRFIGSASGGSKPTTPTIGAATDDGTGTGVSVAFTPSTYIGKGTITYTATSSPGSLTASGAGSPLVVSGLTTGTAYTFTVKGTTNYGVVSDSSAASNSVTPASPTAFDSIATASGSGVSTITFSSIPQTYKSLQIRAIGKSSSASGGVGIRFNGITTTSYYSHRLLGNGSTASASGAAGNRMSDLLVFTDSSHSGYGVGILDIIDYFSTSKNTTVRSFDGFDRNGAGEVYLSSALFNNTAAVTSITIYDLNGTNWTTGTSFALYGVK